MPAGDLFAFDAFLYVKYAGGSLSINETNGAWGGSSRPFFSACGPLLPKGVTVPVNRTGKIKQTGAPRKNESGMTATVWRIAPQAAPSIAEGGE